LGKENVITRISSRMKITKKGEGPWRKSSWREILRGETISVDRLLLGEQVFVERSTPWRDSSWRNSLHGENSRGERRFMERLFEEREASGRTRLAYSV
jgi:hypothetical protein